jgi:glutaminyl-peptide cyclotransferase
MKIETEIDEFEDGPGDRRGIYRNVVGIIKGKTAGLIVLGSHYDTKAGISESFNGANDSGSSTGLLLELARVLSVGPKPECSIMLAFFDGEECVREYSENDGLHGSRRLARRLKEDGRAAAVLGVIVVDMIGDKRLNVELPRNSTPSLCSIVFSAAREEGARSAFRLSNSAVLDDHVPFLAAGMPAVDIIDFQYGSAPGLNDYWHTEHDTLDKISGESMQLVGRIVVRMINSLMTGNATRHE